MIGSALSQLIPVVFSPFLARLYTPADFGHLAIFMAVTAVLGMASSGLYEYAIILPKEDKEAVNIVFLISLIAVLFSIISFLIFFLLHHFFNFEGFYLLLALSIPFAVTYNVLNYWFNRYKQYKKLNLLRILQACAIVVISFALYRFKFGLILGFLAGGLLGFSIFMMVFIKHIHLFNKNLLKNLAIEYKKFPTLILPTSLMNTVSSYAPVFFIKRGYSASQLGSYSMSARVLTAPVSVMSTAIGQIYFKNMSDYYNNNQTHELKKLFYNNSKILLLLSCIIFIPLFLFGKQIMLLIFGSAWETAGHYLEILALSSIVKFVVSPLSTVLIVKRELKKVARWQILYFITTLILFIIFINFKIETLLWAYVFHETALYIIYYLIMRSVVEDYYE